MSQSFVSTPWFGAAAGAFFSAALAWVRSFARRATPEDLRAVEKRIGERMDQLQAAAQNIEGRIDTLYRELLGAHRK